MVVTVKILKKHRDTNNKIIKYTIQDTASGKILDITPKKLKSLIDKNKIYVKDHKLTLDGRLIASKNINHNLETDKTKICKYILMNKNTRVAFLNCYFEVLDIKDKMPIGFNTVREWIESRARFSCARNVKEFFSTIGINSTEDLIYVTHCVSLHDTFWIKECDSELNWNNVSPFRHDYSEVISIYALEGKIICKDKNYFSPVISTDGTFPHTWKFNNGHITFIKAGSKYTLGGSNSGREPYSEYYASVIANYLGFEHVHYDIRNHKRQDNRIDIVTECKCYTTEEIGSISAYKLGLTSYEMILDYCRTTNNIGYLTILNMLFLDCLLLNTDRHFSNIEFFIDNRTLEVLRMVPIFDNNYSLLPRFIEGYDTFDRSEYMARDGRTFDEIYELITQHKSFKGELIKLKKLVLKKPETVDIKPERLKFLNEFLQMQVDYLLSK